MVIAIEGLPGAGKTTSTELLAGRLDADALIETTADHPFLASVYAEEGRHDLQVELAFLVLHFGGYRTASREKVTVCDFSPVKDLLFAWDMLRGVDLEIFERLYDRLYEGHPAPDVVLFLDLPPEACLARVRARGRSFEAGMTLERLHRMYELYLNYLPKLGANVQRVPLLPGPSPEEVADRLIDTLRDVPSLR